MLQHQLTQTESTVSIGKQNGSYTTSDVIVQPAQPQSSSFAIFSAGIVAGIAATLLAVKLKWR